MGAMAPTISVTETCSVPLSELHPYPANPRRGNVELIRQSVRAHGQYRALVVNRRSMEVLAGNHLLQAMEAEGFAEALVHLVDVDDQEAARIVLVDNRASDLGIYDDSLLAELLQGLPDLEGTGYDERALTRLLDSIAAKAPEDPDAIAEPAREPVSKPGDLWLCGEHRVLCGDATDPAARARLLEGIAPRLIVTDPPYGVSVDHRWRNSAGLCGRAKTGTRDRILNDTQADWSGAVAAFGCPVAYVWCASLHLAEVQLGLEAQDYELRALIVWVKPEAVISRGHYHWRHEPCWYMVRRGEPATWLGDRKQTTVWEAPVPGLGYTQRLVGPEDERPAGGHASQKPCLLWERPITNHLARGEWLVDPFLGSGTALVAAEMTGRRLAAMELAPAWVDASLARWQRYTGQIPRRESGEEVSFVASQE